MRKLLGLLTQNWKLKFLALVLALLLWVVVSGDQVRAEFLQVPLQVENADPNYRLIPGSVPDEVRVRFEGRRADLVDIYLRRPPLRLTVREVDDTVEVRNLAPGMVVLQGRAGNVEARDVQPNSVRLRFVGLRTRQLPIRPRVAQGPGEGYTLVDSLRVEPARLLVRGPIERVEALHAAFTEPLTISGRDTLFSRVVALDTTELAGLELSARRVQVTGRVEEVATRVLEQIPISVGSGVRVEPDTVSVAVQGPESRVAGLTGEQLRVFISIDSIPSRIPPEGLMVPLRVERLPAGVRAQAQPASVRLLPAYAPGEEPLGQPVGPPGGPPGAGAEREPVG